MIFESFIEQFNELVKSEPKVNAVKSRLLEIKSDAKTCTNLTLRQLEAVNARVDNYLNGKYGNTKKAEHFNNGK